MSDEIPHPKDQEEPRIEIQRAEVSDVVLRRVYNSAQDMCPTPLEYEKLKSWADACPEFCIHFQATLEGADTAPVGVVFMLPILRKYWEALLVGDIQESDLDPATMFAVEGEADVGLHVFYVERFKTGRCQRNFGDFALNTTRMIAKNKGWNLFGFSGKFNHAALIFRLHSFTNLDPEALSATAAGRAASRQLGFLTTGYEEMALVSYGRLRGTKFSIIYMYPDGRVQGREGYGQFHSKSEMFVRYENPFQALAVKSRL